MRIPWTGAAPRWSRRSRATARSTRPAVRRLARRQIDAGIHFLVPCGTTGESPTLTEDERVRVVELVVEEAAGRVPVLAGAGGYDTREVIHTALRMKRAGADGILSVTPYYNKPTPEGLFQHYTRDRRRSRAADHRLQRAGTHRLQRRRRDAGAPRRRAGTSSASRKRRATSRRCARSAARCRTTSSCCRATMR